MTTPTGAPSGNGANVNTPPQVHWRPYSFDDVINMPPKQWRVEGMIGEKDKVMFFGGSGDGKTFVIIDLINAMCLGKDFCGNYDLQNGWKGKFKIKRPLVVCYMAGEGIGGLPDRFRAAAQFYGVQAGGLPNFYFFPATPQVADGVAGSDDGIVTFVHDWQQLQAAGEVAPLDVLIIDTLHTAMSGMEENSSKDGGITLRRLQKAIDVLGCAVVLVHHAQKNGELERGTTSLRAGMDAVIRIHKNGENVMSCSKLKDGEMWQPERFLIKPWPNSNSAVVFWEGTQGAGTNHKGPDIGDQVYELLAKEPNRRFTSGQLAKALGLSENKVSNALNRLAAKGKAYRHTVDDKTRTQPGRHICEWQDVLGAKSP